MPGAQGVVQDPGPGQSRIEGAERVLRDEGDAVTQRGAAPLGEFQPGFAEQAHFAALGATQREQRTEQTALAGTRGADEPERLPRQQLEADPVHRGVCRSASAVAHGDLPGAEGGISGGRARRDPRCCVCRHRGGQQPGPAGPVPGHRGDQIARVTLPRGAEDLGGGAGFHDASAPHDQHPIGDLGDAREVVADQQEPRPGGHPIREQREHSPPQGAVEGGGGFVGDDQSGAQDQSGGDQSALALPAGELVRAARETGRGRFDARITQGRGDPGAELVASRTLVQAHGVADLGEQGAERVEGRHRVLLDERDDPAA